MLVPPSNFIYVEEGIYKSSYIDTINYLFLESLNLRSILLLDVETPPENLYRFLKKNDIQLYQISPHGRMHLNNYNHNSNTNISQNAPSEHGRHMLSKGSSVKYYDTNAINSIVGSHELQYVDPNIDTLDFENEIIYISNNNDHHYNHHDGKNNIDDSWMIINRNLLLKIFEIILDKRTHNILIVDSMDVVVSILRKIEKINFSSILTEYRFYADKNVSYKVENFLELIQIELESSTKFENEEEYKCEDLPEFNSEDARRFSNSFQGLKVTNDPDIRNELNQNSYTASAIGPSNSESIQKLNQNNYTADTVDSGNDCTSYECKNAAQKIGSPIRYSTSYKSGTFDNSYKTPTSLTANGSRRPSYCGDEGDDLSTSPQIPSNLLRLMEIRKHKSSGTHDGDNMEFTAEQQPNYENHDNGSTDEPSTIADVNEFLEHRSLLSSKFDKFLPKLSPMKSSNKYSKYYNVFYKRFTRDKFGDNIDPIVKLKLPNEENLPDWFKIQRDLWVQDYMEINNL